MNSGMKFERAAFLTIGLLAAMPLGAQSFGASKEKVTLMRKLPGLVHLSGNTIAVRVSGGSPELNSDLQSLLEAELLKDNPDLRAESNSASTIVSCRVTDFAHPQPTVTTRSSLAVTKTAPKQASYERVTGSLSVSFVARSAGGSTYTSDNVTAKYDREFDANGNTASEGVKGTMTSAWKRVTGGASTEDLDPPTDAELRSHLELEVVHKIAEHLVNTSEAVEVYLAKERGPLDQGDKEAVAGLWEKALETFETAPPNPKPAEDAYRLYDTGVAYEALAYKAEDPQMAMKYLDEAAIDYGKAIDARPGEQYFLEPQRRIQDAIAHYRQLEAQRHPAPAPAPPAEETASGKPASTARGLTNAQVIAMVKSGMDDDTVAQAVRAAHAVQFDLTTTGQQALTSGGVSPTVLAAMKSRAARTHTASASRTASHAN
jgi:tetratricopeptide (TPR) repeat protein